MRNTLCHRRMWWGLLAGLLTGALCLAAPSAARASSVLTTLPAGFGGIAVDGAHDHVFVSSPTSNTISVLDFSGNLLQTITGETGAGSMTVYGGFLYVALPSAIDVFDTSTLTRTATLASGQLSHPGQLVEAGGELWTSTGACGNWSTQLVSVDPATGAVTQWPTSSSSSLTYCIGLAASPYNPNLLLAWDLGLEPATITEFNVTNGTPVQTASQWESDQGNLKQIAFNPDDSTFVTASGSPYYFDEFSLSNLSLDGVTYPANAYPNAVVTSSARGGLIAGASVTATNAVYTYHPGQPGTDLFNPSLPYPVYDRGLALSPDGTDLFAVLQGSSSTVLDVLPVLASTTTSLSASSSSVAPGTPVTFTATVTATPGWAAPTGTVTFTSGADQSTVQLVNGQASFTTSWASAGTYEVTAVYNGDANDATSSAYTIETVGSTTSTSLSSSANPSEVGQPVTFTATVTPTSSNGTEPSGSVTFEVVSPAAGNKLGTVPLSNGQASLTTSSLPSGTDDIVAVYSGDSYYGASSSNTVAETVNPAPTTVTVTSSANPATAGQQITFTASVASGTAPAGSATSAGTVTGSVTFFDGSTALATEQLSNGTAAYTTSLSVGTHAITASYSGSASYQSSTSSALQETVDTAPSSTTLSSSQNPAKWKSPVTFTATVIPSTQNVTLTGTVTFYLGSKALATVSLSGSLTAPYTTSSLPVGYDTITAVYSGNASFAGSQAQFTEQIKH